MSDSICAALIAIAATPGLAAAHDAPALAPPANDRFYQDVEWSPDGEHLVFYRSTGEGRDQVWVRNVDGAKEWNLTDDGANNIFPTYLADGTIAFVAGHWPRAAIYVMRSDGVGVQKIVN